MTRKRRLDLIIYTISDFFTAMLAWACFFVYRKQIEGVSWGPDIVNDEKFWYGIIIIPIGWVLLYGIFDDYRDLYRMSRMRTLAKTFFLTFVGVTFLFFALILDDFVKDYKTYYQSFIALFLFHFSFTSVVRMILLTRASRRLKAGKITYNTLLIGGNQNALELYKEISSMKKGLGNKFVGFIETNGLENNPLEQFIPRLGTVAQLNLIIEHHSIEEVIIAVETSEHNKVKGILDQLFDYGDKLMVRIIPDMYDILLGTVKMNHIYGAVLIEIKQELMPRWQRLLKRLIDIVASFTFLVLLSPLYFYIMIRVRLSSPGPIFYRQKRIGQYGVPFTIFKFRSMKVNAEKDGPQLSHDHDNRITHWGRIMRKWRLDELPQFWNVLRGDMSLVGPRPERQYYIDLIMEQAPHYKHLLKVRPGITSWGQVKYGYASSVEEMLQRLKFDILYIENMSLALDFKILFYTALVLLQGKGK